MKIKLQKSVGISTDTSKFWAGENLYTQFSLTGELLSFHSCERRYSTWVFVVGINQYPRCEETYSCNFYSKPGSEWHHAITYDLKFINTDYVLDVLK